MCPRATHFATKISETRVFPADVGAAYKRFLLPFRIFSKQTRILGRRPNTGTYHQIKPVLAIQIMWLVHFYSISCNFLWIRWAIQFHKKILSFKNQIMVFYFRLSIRSLHEISVWFTLKKYCTLWLIQNWLTRISTNQMNQLKILSRYRNKNGSNHRISHWLLKRADFEIQKTSFVFIPEKIHRQSLEKQQSSFFGLVDQTVR